MKKSFLRKAFAYWQSGPMHPFTCMGTFGGSHNLSLKRIDKDGRMHLYCKHCPEYHQLLTPELQSMVVRLYTEYLKTRKRKVEFFFKWCDLWVGVYIDKRSDAVYICPLPMVGIKISWKTRSPYEIAFEKAGLKDE